MSDNKEIQDGRDRVKVDPKSDYELRYLEEKFGVSRNRVLEAIRTIGNNRKEIEQYLEKFKQ